MKHVTASLTIAAAALLAVGCSGDDESATTSDTEPAAEADAAPESEAPADEAPADEAPAEGASASGAAIEIEGFAFSSLDPVAPGTEITVSNLDGAQHTLTADDGSFNTGGLDGDATTTITAPDAPGTYSFICNIHPQMTGSLTVEA